MRDFGFSHKSVRCSLGLCAGGACDRHEAAISRNPAGTLRHSAIAFRMCTHHVLYTFKKKKNPLLHHIGPVESVLNTTEFLL